VSCYVVLLSCVVNSSYNFCIRVYDKLLFNTDSKELPFTGKGILVNSGKYDGLSSEEGIESILKDAKQNKYGSRLTLYNLRDWLISRQRSD